MKKSELRQLIREEAKRLNESKHGMTLDEFSAIFRDFYDDISEYSEFMDEDTIKNMKSAMKYLDAAMESEFDAHGVDLHKLSMKL